MKTLKTGSPTVTVNNPAKTNTTTSIVSSLERPPTATGRLHGAGHGFRPGDADRDDYLPEWDVVLGISPLNSLGQATVTTNRFSVADSPAWIHRRV